jgi:hypothetical protein
MGFSFYDQYSLLHFATGVVAFFWGLSIETWIVLNIIFEITENSQIGYKLIKDRIKEWPGSKPSPDSKINSVMDIIFGIIGYLVAKKLYMHFDRMYVKLGYKQINVSDKSI